MTRDTSEFEKSQKHSNFILKAFCHLNRNFGVTSIKQKVYSFGSFEFLKVCFEYEYFISKITHFGRSTIRGISKSFIEIAIN